MCIDKFKDTLTAPEAVSTIKSVLESRFGEGISVEEVPVSDGGEGFLDCVEMAKSTGDDRVERVPVEVKGAMPG